ncbi:CRISPR-associated protein Cas4 [Fervidobacterium islandicum]|uniref:CRISPR-associated exonuclease Cas4 n=1 Tax=Fervidobacterium islandicum TaxID=2423 RepID=A0AAI8CKM8_FERIS|nr:CRISPR-associated protein Cas4 [Fervidobacterium islandicum]AMW33134.1 CRISPR-associated protein Cas4 [Fervidobacterium islandicum]
MENDSFKDFDNYEEILMQGTKVNYYFVCKRKLWFYSKGITMEKNDDSVLLGKLFHEEEKEKYGTRADVEIDGVIKLDRLDAKRVFELKSTKSMKEAAKYQLLYYIYVLKLKGIKRTGVLVLKNSREYVELTPEEEQKLVDVIQDIKRIVKASAPPKQKKTKKCDECAYYELCFGGADM